MKNSFKQVMHNIWYSFSANIISLVLSIISLLIVPKLLSVEIYGVWQLYLFYVSYVGFFHFGWIDGIYLRYGGIAYKQLNFQKLSGQYWALMAMECAIATSVLVAVRVIHMTAEMTAVLQMVVISGIFIIGSTFSSFILQITSRIKNYAYLMIYERILLLVSITGFVILGCRSYSGLLRIGPLVEFVVFLYSIHLIKEIVFHKTPKVTIIIREALENVQAGSNLMAANIASMLIIGIIRIGISQGWDISTFGRVSLTLNISNFVMAFINSVGVVMFPILRQINPSCLSALYKIIRLGLTVALLALLFAYYPLKTLIGIWLPQYRDSLVFMVMLLPICIFEGKMSILVNTYLKSLRKEKWMLKINLMALGLSAVITFVTVWVLHSLNLTVLSITVVLAFRCMVAEKYLGKLLNINLLHDILWEAGIVCVFVVMNWYVDSWLTMIGYGVLYGGYVFAKRDEIINCFGVFMQYKNEQ